MIKFKYTEISNLIIILINKIELYVYIPYKYNVNIDLNVNLKGRIETTNTKLYKFYLFMNKMKRNSD